MATNRRPKGTYTRPSTDFFPDRCMIGGVMWVPANGSSGIVELFNNAADGSNLHVYRIWVQTDAGGAYWITRQTGSMGGTTVQTYAVQSDGGILPGQISYGVGGIVHWTPPGPFVMPAFIAANNEAGSQDTFQAPGPVCILVPGDSLRVFSPSLAATSTGIVAATFYWAALRDSG